MSLRFLPCSKKQLSEFERSGLISPSQPIVATLDEAAAARPGAILVLKDTDHDVEDSSLSAVAGVDVDRRLPGAPESSSLPIRREQVLNVDPYRAPRSVSAGGGLLVRPGSPGPEIVLIYRRGVWDLPKGKLDRGESIEQCAVREVNEELGIGDAAIIAPAGTTVHGYAERDRYMVKTTWWYVMHTSAGRFTPQAEEQIERVEWMSVDEAVARVGFDGLKDLLVRSASLLSSVL